MFASTICAILLFASVSCVIDIQTVYSNRQLLSFDVVLQGPSGVVTVESNSSFPFVFFLDADKLYRLEPYKKLEIFEDVPILSAGLTVDSTAKSLYVACSNHIKKTLLSDGASGAYKVAGDTAPTEGNTAITTIIDGPAMTAVFNYIKDIVYWDGGRPGNEAIIVAEGWYDPEWIPNVIRMYHIANDTVTTLAGGLQPSGFKNGFGKSAKFKTPAGIDLDPRTNTLYIADSQNHAIRSMNLITLMVTTIVGNGKRGYVDGPFNIASFHEPFDVLFDDKTNSILVADLHNNCIREVLLDTNMTITVVGDGTAGYYDGIGKDSQLNGPFHLAFDPKKEEVYITESRGRSIRKFNRKSRFITTLVKTKGQGYENGPGGFARFNGPAYLAMDTRFDLKTNAVLLSDEFNNAIRRVNLTTGEVTSISGMDGISGFKDGPARIALFNGPKGIALDPISRAIFISDSNNNVIRMINASNYVSTFAGSGEFDLKDGLGLGASFSYPWGLALDPASRNLYVADRKNYVIRRVNIETSLVETVAGSGVYGYVDGKGTVAMFSELTGITLDENYEFMLIVDNFNSLIRKMRMSDFSVTTVAGDGWHGYKDGPALAAKIAHPEQITIDYKNGDVYFADYLSNTVRKLSNGYVSTFAGSLTSDLRNGQLENSLFYTPSGIIYNPIEDSLIVCESMNYAVRRLQKGRVTSVAGNGASAFQSDELSYKTFTGGLVKPMGLMLSGGSLIVSDSGNNMIVKIGSDLKIKRLTGNGEVGWFDSKALNDSEFNNPQALIPWKNDSMILVADTGNHVIRLVNLQSGEVSTIAGSGKSGLGNGAPKSAQFDRPTGLAVDPISKGNIVYVCDSGNHAIRKVTILKTTIVSLLAGTGEKGYKDGVSAASKFSSPADIITDEQGHIYIADTMNNAIRVRNRTTGNITTLIGSLETFNTSISLRRPQGIALHSNQRTLFISDSGHNSIIQFDILSRDSSTLMDTREFVESGQIKSTLNTPTKLLFDPSSAQLIVLDSYRNAIRKFDMSPAKVISTTGLAIPIESNHVIIAIAAAATTLSLILASIALWKRKASKNSKLSQNVSNILEGYARKDLSSTSFSFDSTRSKTVSNSQSVAIAMPGYLRFNDYSKHFKVERALGEGGTSNVFSGKIIDAEIVKRTGCLDVAIKQFDDSYSVPSFNYEVIIMSKLPSDCPYVAKFIGYSDKPKMIFIKFYPLTLMDYINRLKDASKIPVHSTLSMISDIAKGMQVIHSKGIIHFDLKPANVMIELDATLKNITCVVCDFGFANFIDDGQRQLVAGMRTPTSTGITARYAAPELFLIAENPSSDKRPNLKIHQMIDVFAFAMTAATIVCGKKPWHKLSALHEVKGLIMKGDRPTLPEDLNENIASMIRKCWASLPQDRMTFDQILEVMSVEMADLTSKRQPDNAEFDMSKTVTSISSSI